MHHAPYMYQLFLTHQMLSAGILGHSPVAQGFFQSYQPQMSASYPYSTPLGPLSPFAAVSGSLPVRYQHSLLTPSHTHIVTSPLPHILTLLPLLLTAHTHTATFPPPHPSHSHPHTATSPLLHTLTLPLLHPLTPELWSWSLTTRADCRPWDWLHLHLPPPPVHRHTITLSLRASLSEVHHGSSGDTHLSK